MMDTVCFGPDVHPSPFHVAPGGLGEMESREAAPRTAEGLGGWLGWWVTPAVGWGQAGGVGLVVAEVCGGDPPGDGQRHA